MAVSSSKQQMTFISFVIALFAHYAHVSASTSTSSNTPCAPTDSAVRPNIVMILFDGIGWGDLSGVDGLFPTPNLDKLYHSSVRLTRHYVHYSGSASRTQFLTGRYAMNLGFGDFRTWEDSVIGGIPIGQPTLPQWLSALGGYRTYGVGKWHCGYANARQLPLDKGFDHFFGFYQDTLDLDTLTFDYHGVPMRDLWDDNVAVDIDALDANDSENINAFELFSEKVMDYIDAEGDAKIEDSDESAEPSPFFLYLGAPSMHSPFASFPEREAECAALIGDIDDSSDALYSLARVQYCAMLFATDDLIGVVMDSLRANELWPNTLLIVSSVNGGEIARGANNYPLRGSAGEVHDGNGRVLAMVSGGVMAGKLAQDHSHLVSSLDWTPTLLEFAGITSAPCFEPSWASWDGLSQYASLMGSRTKPQQHENDQNEKKSDNENDKIGEWANPLSALSAEVQLDADVGALKRTALVLDVKEAGDAMSVVLSHEHSLFKYVKMDSGDSGKLSAFVAANANPSDSWSRPHGQDIYVFSGDETDALWPVMRFSQPVDGEYLFDLTHDESEIHNLLQLELPGYDGELNALLIRNAQRAVRQFLDADQLFCPEIEFLHEALSAAVPSMENEALGPFLSDDEYDELIHNAFVDSPYPDPLGRIYQNLWLRPDLDLADSASESDSVELKEKVVSPVKVGEGEKESAAVARRGTPLEWWGVLLIVMAAISISVPITVAMMRCCRDRDGDVTPRGKRGRKACHADYQTFAAEQTEGSSPSPPFSKPRVTL